MSSVRIAGITALMLVLVAGLALGGIFYGQSTRQSNDEVATLVSQKVRAEDRSSDRAQDEALTEQEARLDHTHRQRVKRLNRNHREALQAQKDAAYEDGQSVGYSSGFSSGNTEGFEQGHEDGLQDGSDDLVCSDDLDVTWLPACDF